MTTRRRCIILTGVLALLCACRGALAEDLLYTDAEADCAAQMIYLNECSGKEANLIYWSADEAFPSLGIGHFIWYPENADGPYLESFPAFLEFAREAGLTLPAWIAAMPEPHSPWPTREAFNRDLKSDRVKELRDFLSRTQRQQAQYIIRRFLRVFPRILDDLDEAERKPVQDKYDWLLARRGAVFAMIDYVNFKGEGLRRDARYDGVGWGLAQVLIEMAVPDDPDQILNEFVLAGERVLENRVRHSPRPEVESKWLPGWKSRLRRYRDIVC